MDLKDAIFHRRAIRRYTDEDVSKEMIWQLLDAAVHAPSALNQQPWSFAVIRGRAQLDVLSEQAKAYMLSILPQSLSLHRRSDELLDDHYNVFHHAGTLIVICARPMPHQPNEDCCLAAQNLMLMAHGLGLGTCPIGFVRPWLDLMEVKMRFGIPLGCSVVMPIVVGWPAAPLPKATTRNEADVFAWLEGPAALGQGAQPSIL